jgi:alpha-L-fucosidase
MSDNFSRRDMLKGTGASLLALAATPAISAMQTPTPPQAEAPKAEAHAPADQPYPNPVEPQFPERMKWWHEARFGMFIHWGLYSVLGRHEWAMENEATPIKEYEAMAKRFKPQPNAARAWAKLAKQAGMKYMVMTTKHHEGFCQWDTKLTNYCAPKQAAGRDLVREYVEAARAEGLRVGFYYSLMDWHHPDGARAKHDEAARKRFVEYTHGLIRELMTNYGKIDILWYDVSWPLSADEWEAERMNKMVFELQPGIIVNNRNKLPGDFATPEQKIVAEARPWESCMTLNDSWGYQPADDAWKNPKTVVRNLITCVRDGGNYLLNIGPKPDGSVPEESARILSEVGDWMARNGQSIYTSDPCQVRRSNYASFTRKGNTLYMHVHFWPGDYVVVSGLLTKVKSAKMLATGTPLQFEQDKLRVVVSGLPKQAPDEPVTTIALECASEPLQNQYVVRNERPRDGVGI